MRTYRTLLLGGAASMLMASAALGADPSPVNPVVTQPQAIAPPTTLSAYVEVFGGIMRGLHTWDEGYWEDRERALGFGGAGRAAWQMSPTLSLQLDVWADNWTGRSMEYAGGDLDYEEEWVDARSGIAAHLTHGGTTGLRFGPLVSLGAEDGDERWANIGLESVFNADRFRIYVQGGYSTPLNESDKDDEEKGYYAQAVTTLYLRPTLAISGNVGFDVWRWDAYGDIKRTVTLGGRMEFQPEGTPLSLFAAYQGRFYSYNYEDPDELNRHHFFGVGVSLLVGQPTIQDRDRAVGLVDYNGIYGQIFR